MAAPSVLTVPSMYGDGILYSGPSAYGSELVTNGDFSDGLNGWTLSTSPPTLNPDNTVTFDDSSEFIFRSWTDVVGTKYRIVFEGVGSIRYRTGFAGSDGTIVPINLPCEVDLLATADTNRIQIYGSLSQGNGILKSVSIKEITQGSDFDFTRATTGTRINEDGYIEDVPYNFIPYSQDIDNADWDKVGTTVSANEIIAPDNSLTGDKINENAGGTYHNVNHDDSVTNGTTYTASAYFKAAERTTACIYENLGIGGGTYPLSSFNLSNGTVDSQDANHIAKISSAGSGWYRCSITFTTNGTRTGSIYYAPNNQLTYTGVLNSGVFMWGAQFVKGDKVKDYLPTTDRLNLPRLNYPIYSGCPSLLMEPQRTNIVEYSEDIDSIPGLSDVGSSIIIDSNIVSPAGLKSVSLLKEDSSNGSHFTFKDWSLTNPSTNTISIFAKSNGGRNLRFGDGGVGWSSGFTANFDLTTGISDTGLMEYYGNGWYRCSVQGTANAATSRLIVYITDGTTTSYQGDNTSGIYLYGFQIEQGSYPTSLIHTAGSSQTRNEDVAFNAGLGTTDTFNDSEGVLYAEIRSDDPEPTAMYTSINDGGGAQNQVRIGYLIGSLYSQIRVAGSAFYNVNITEADVTQNNKVAVRYKAEDHAVFLNGFKLSTDTSNTIFAAGTLDRVNFSAFGTSGEFRGENKALAVYKTALTDTELANLTSYNNHDLFIPYRSRMQLLGADQELQCTEHDITRFL